MEVEREGCNTNVLANKANKKILYNAEHIVWAYHLDGGDGGGRGIGCNGCNNNVLLANKRNTKKYIQVTVNWPQSGLVQVQHF